MSVQMIDLMAECSRKQFLAFQFDPVHILVKCLYLDIIRPCHNSCFSREAQAALISGLFPACLNDLRIDQNDRSLSDIDDNNTF